MDLLKGAIYNRQAAIVGSNAHRGGGVPSVKSYVAVCSNPLVHGGRRASSHWLLLAPTPTDPRVGLRSSLSPRLSPIHHPKPMSFQRRAGGRNDMQPPAVKGVVLPMVWKCVVNVRIKAWAGRASVQRLSPLGPSGPLDFASLFLSSSSRSVLQPLIRHGTSPLRVARHFVPGRCPCITEILRFALSCV